jgi:chromosome segregation ATPase
MDDDRKREIEQGLLDAGFRRELIGESGTTEVFTRPILSLQEENDALRAQLERPKTPIREANERWERAERELYLRLNEAEARVAELERERDEAVNRCAEIAEAVAEEHANPKHFPHRFYDGAAFAGEEIAKRIRRGSPATSDEPRAPRGAEGE